MEPVDMINLIKAKVLVFSVILTCIVRQIVKSWYGCNSISL